MRSEAVLRFGIVALLVAAVEMLCRLHIIPVDVASSHFPFLENPAAFNAVVKEFFDRS